MKAIHKTALLPVFILLLSAVFAYVQPSQAVEPTLEPEAAPPDRQGSMFNEDYITGLLRNIKQDDPNEAARLERLRQNAPKLFRLELRRYTRRQKAQYGDPRPRFSRRRETIRGEEDEPMERSRRDRRRERGRAFMETVFINWLEENAPETAQALAELKDKDYASYRQRLSIEMGKYREIIEAEQANPALAKLLKKDLRLKQKRSELFNKLKAATDDKQKEELTAQLEEVISERFDLILQKKQLKYEELKKKLKELQQKIKRSQSQIEDFKNKRSEYIKEDMEKQPD